MSLKSLLNFFANKKVAEPDQRSHNKKHTNNRSKEKSMSQAKVLSERELRKVMLYCAAHPHAARNKAMLLMTHLAGMRVGEVAALRLADVITSEGEITNEVRLAAGQTKGDRGRTVLIPERLRDELQIYLRSRYGSANLFAVCYESVGVALFPTQKHPRRGFSASTLTQYFHYLYKRCGIAGASSHSGRRSFITNLAERGVGVHVLMHLAGHRSIATTQKYISVTPSVMRAAVELI
jgi:integrase/recombinase XerD